MTPVTSEQCFALILMPNSPQRSQVCLQSIQFAFNRRGEILELSFVYVGHDIDIQKKAKETLTGIVDLKKRHQRGESLCVFNDSSNTLTISLVAGKDSKQYLSDIMDFIKDKYLMKTDFAQDIKSQIISEEYLEEEFIRLRGKSPEKQSFCCLM